MIEFGPMDLARRSPSRLQDGTHRRRPLHARRVEALLYLLRQHGDAVGRVTVPHDDIARAERYVEHRERLARVQIYAGRH